MRDLASCFAASKPTLHISVSIDTHPVTSLDYSSVDAKLDVHELNPS